MKALLDAAKGTMKQVDFEGTVEFAQASQRASGQKARYDAVTETLFLTGDARVQDEGQGSDLRAEAIDLGTRKESVSARGSVRHTVTRTRPASRPGLLSREEPAVFLAPALRLRRRDSHRPLPRERAPALGKGRGAGAPPDAGGAGAGAAAPDGHWRGGIDPLPAPGARRDEGAGAGRDAQQGDGLRRGEEPRHLQGDVEIRQGDIRTKSPEAVVPCPKDGSDLENAGGRASRWRWRRASASATGAAGHLHAGERDVRARGREGRAVRTPTAAWRAAS